MADEPRPASGSNEPMAADGDRQGVEQASESASAVYPIEPFMLRDRRWLLALYEDLAHRYYWTATWSPSFYIELAKAGFISIATEHPELGSVLVPELQEAYAVLDWPELHVSRKASALLTPDRLRREGLELSVVDDVTPVLDRLVAYHGESSWLSREYRVLLNALPSAPTSDFRLRGVELRAGRDRQLVAGELGYTLGRTYTSLSGFCDRSHRRLRGLGTLQMILLARRLEQANYAFWNLGHPKLAYKRALGARVVPRLAFLTRWLAATRERAAHLV